MKEGCVIMAFCSSCGSNIPERIKFCPACGAPVTAPQQPVYKPEPQPVQQVTYTPAAEHVHSVPALQKNNARFPVAALIFAIFAFTLWIINAITNIGIGSLNFKTTLDILDFSVFGLVHFCLLLGICLYKAKGHIITGIPLLLYFLIIAAEIIRYIGYYTTIDNFYDLVGLIDTVIILALCLFAGLHYVLGGGGIGKPVKTVFTILYLIISIVWAITMIVMAVDYYSSYPDMMLDMIRQYGMGGLRNICLCVSLLAFTPVRT